MNGWTLREWLILRWDLLRYEARKRRERATLRLARSLPLRLRYWVFIDIAADATQTGHLTRVPVPEVPLMEALEVWGNKHGVEP